MTGARVLVTVLVTACAVLAVVAVAFVIGASTGKHSIMDVAWGASIAVAGLVSLPGVNRARRPRPPLAAGGRARAPGVPGWALHIAVRARGKGRIPLR